MSKDTIYNEGADGIIAGRTPQLNLGIGGQQGAMVSNFQWTSSAAYARQKLIAVLVSVPELMKYLPNPELQYAALKSLIEVMPLTIDGLSSTINWTYSDTPVGNAGETMETAIDAKRTKSVPNFAWSEKYGMSIARYWTSLTSALVLDPDLQLPGIIASPEYIAAGSPAILPEQQSFSVMFIEPDITLTRVTNAWLSTNMMAKTGGDIIGKREIAGAAEVPTVTIPFTSMTMEGAEINKAALEYLKTLSLADLRPLELRSYNEELNEGKPLEGGTTAVVQSAAEGFLSKSTAGNVGTMTAGT